MYSQSRTVFSGRDQVEDLQRLCVEVVAQNFERFLQAYRDSASKIPRRNFEFLQRTQSKELLEEISKRQCLSDEHMEFLMNPYLTELNVPAMKYRNPEQILTRLRVMGEVIRSVNLKSQEFWTANHLLQLIELVPKIETLQISRTECSNAVLKSIGTHCRHLNELNISGCFAVCSSGVTSLLNVDAAGNLVKNTTLKKLYLPETNVNDMGIAFCLENFPSLMILQIDGVDDVIYKKHFSAYDEGRFTELPKYNLTNLDVDLKYFPEYTEVERKTSLDTIKICTMVCPDVRSLFVSGITQQSELMTCADFDKLEDVNFTFHRKAHCDLSAFLAVRGGNLLKLGLFRCEISVECLAKWCKKLKTLQLHRVKFQANDDDKLQATRISFPHVKVMAFILDFNKSASTKAVASLLSAGDKLESLSLRLCESISDDAVDCLLKNLTFKNLEEIDLSRTDITANSVRKFLWAAPKLKKLLLNESLAIPQADYMFLVRCLTTEKRNVIIEWTPRLSRLEDLPSDEEMSLSEMFSISSDSMFDLSTSSTADEDSESSMDEEDSFDEEDDDMDTDEENN